MSCKELLQAFLQMQRQKNVKCQQWEDLLEHLPAGAYLSSYDRGQVLEVEWPDDGILLVMNDEELMFTQYDGQKITGAWDALWRDHSPRQMADRIKFYFG